MNSKKLLRIGLPLLLILLGGGGIDLSAQVNIDTTFAGRGARPFDQPIDPDRYLIRPGEQLEVVFLNAKLGSLRLTVDAEGRLIHRDLGVFDLAGKTLSRAREILLEPLAKLFNAPEIVISVASIYPVYIQVSGMVNRPGAYSGYTSQRVSEIIDSAGGVAPGGSTRRISFYGGPERIAVDLDQYKYGANSRFNPCLYAGFRIHVPPREIGDIQILGEVTSPRAVELLTDESFVDMGPLIGGLLPSADRDAVYLLNDSTRDVWPRGALRPGDVVVVPPRSDIVDDERVSLVGAVTHPGRYELSGERSLAAVVAAAGGFLTGANRERVTVFRLPERDALGRRALGRYPLSLTREHQMNEMTLQPGDSVYVPLLLGYVSVTGLVARPGMVPYLKDKTVADYIRMVGGYPAPTAEPIVEVTDRVSGITRLAVTGTAVFDGDRIVVRSGEAGR